MAAVIATCFSISLLLGNLCPMRLAAFAASHPPAETEAMAMTPAQGEQRACSTKAATQQPSAFSLPDANTCPSGHCLAKGDPSLWLQVALPPPLPVTASVAGTSPSLLTHPASAPRLHFISSTGPPLKHLRNIVLRI